MFTERRSCLRHKVNGPIFASFDGVTGGMILDLSEQGLSMQTVFPLPTERRLQFRLDLPEANRLDSDRQNSDTLETTGYIAWADALGRAGVRFSELPADARQRLDHWLGLNDETPSRKAPKLTFDHITGFRDEDFVRTTPSGEILKPRSISLEAEPALEDLEVPSAGSSAAGSSAAGLSGTGLSRMDLSSTGSSNIASTTAGSGAMGSSTIQYEFHSLGPDLNTGLRIIGERARTLLRGSGAAIALIDGSSLLARDRTLKEAISSAAARNAILLRPMMCRASVGTGGPPLGTHVDAHSGLSGECIRTGKTLRCDDAETDPRVAIEICRKLRIRSIAAAPIRYEREAVGLIEVFSPDSFAFDEGDLAVLERLAQTALLTVSQSHLLRRG